MIHGANVKTSYLINAAQVATNATASGTIDTIGFDFLQVDVLLDTQAATSSNPATLKLTEGTNTSATSAIGTFTGDDTSDGFTIPNADTSNAQIVQLNVDLRGRERYQKLSVTPAGAAQIVGAVAKLSRAKEAPVGTTDQNVAAVVNG